MEKKKREQFQRRIARWHFMTKALGGSVFLVGMLAMVIAIVNNVKGSNEQSIRTLVTIIMVLVVLYLVSGRYTGRLQQQLNRQIAGTTSVGYFLYLRSIRERGLRTITQSAGPINPLPNAFIIDDIQDELATALKGIGQLFVIGNQDSTSLTWSTNAILLRTKRKDWQNVFKRVASGARGIFLIPGTTSGLIEEMEELVCNGYTDRVIVIMAPITESEGDNRRRIWKEVAEDLLKKGWKLPPFVDDGMVYIAKEDLSPTRVVPYKIGGERRLREALLKILDHLPPKEPTCQMITDVARLEAGVKHYLTNVMPFRIR